MRTTSSEEERLGCCEGEKGHDGGVKVCVMDKFAYKGWKESVARGTGIEDKGGIWWIVIFKSNLFYVCSLGKKREYVHIKMVERLPLGLYD